MDKKRLVWFAAIVATLASCALASGQDLRAWQTLNFADDPETVQAKMEALQESGAIQPRSDEYEQWYSEVARFPMTSHYPMSLGGVDVSLSFDFNDNKLYRLTFTTSGVSAVEWESTVLPEYKTIRSVLRQALGVPASSSALGFFDTTPGFIVWGDVWRSGGISRRLGVWETTGYQYYTYLEIEWDWMAALIAEHEERQQSSDIERAADGF